MSLAIGGTEKLDPGKKMPPRRMFPDTLWILVALREQKSRIAGVATRFEETTQLPLDDLTCCGYDLAALNGKAVKDMDHER